MIISAITSIGLPIALFIVLYKKYNVKIWPLILGMAGYIIFAYVLERHINMVVWLLFPFEAEPPFEKYPLVWILRGVFIAGIFEETVRFIAFKILKKKYTGIETALFYGIGYIGIEGIITACLPLIHPLLYFTKVDFLGISNICLQMSCSVIVFYSVYGTKKLWLYPLAIILHAIIDIPEVAMMVVTKSMDSMILIQFIKILYAIALIIIAKYVHKKLKKSIN